MDNQDSSIFVRPPTSPTANGEEVANVSPAPVLELGQGSRGFPIKVYRVVNYDDLVRVYRDALAASPATPLPPPRVEVPSPWFSTNQNFYTHTLQPWSDCRYCRLLLDHANPDYGNDIVCSGPVPRLSDIPRGITNQGYDDSSDDDDHHHHDKGNDGDQGKDREDENEGSEYDSGDSNLEQTSLSIADIENRFQSFSLSNNKPLFFFPTMAPSANSESKPMYQKDEKAMCFHGEMLYEAKVLDVRRQDPKDKSSPHEYLVHYKGWKNTWDDWVPQDRVRKLTDDNRQLAADLKKELQPVPPKSAAKPATSKSRRGPGGSERGSEDRNSSVPAGGRGTKRGRDNDIEKVGPKKISLAFVSLDDESDNELNLRDLPSPLLPLDTPPNHTPGPSEHYLHGLRAQAQIKTASGIMRRTKLDPLPISAAARRLRFSATSTTTNQNAFSNRSTVAPDSGDGLDDGKTTQTHQAPPSRATKRVKQHPVRKGNPPGLTKARELSPESELDEFSTVDEILARDPPPDEPEYISFATSNSRSNFFCAPLIGGTTMDEKAAIERELVEAGQLDLPDKFHPGYIKLRQEDPTNANRLHFFDGVDPKRKMAIAGVPKVPMVIDPPGVGGPFDALKFPGRLVEVLNRDGPNNLHGWDSKALKKIPKDLMGKIHGHILAQMPHEVLVRLPTTIQDKLPDDAAFFTNLPANSKYKRPHQRAAVLAANKSSSLLALIPASSGSSSMNMKPICDFLDSQAYNHSYSQEENFNSRPSIRIPMPDLLKNLLVDDWENVTKSLLLVPLPSKAPANFIIDTYFHEEKSSRQLGSAEADLLEEFCVGLKVYFEKSVGKILLYRFERQQLADIRKLWESDKYPDWEGKGPGDAYGAEHLCRMIVNMPELVAQTNMDTASINRLREEVSKFCTWLARNSSKYFCAKYEKPTAEYIENAR